MQYKFNEHIRIITGVRSIHFLKKNAVNCSANPHHRNMRSFICLAWLLCLACICHAQGDTVATLRNKLNIATSDSMRVEAYVRLFNYYEYSGPDSATAYINKGIQEFTDKKYQYGIARLTTLQARQDGIQGRRDMARRKYAQALEIYTKLNNRRGIALVENGIGVIDLKTNNEADATVHFMRAMKEFEAEHDTDGIVSTYLKLGVANEQSRNGARALECYNKALELVQTNKPENATQRCDILNNIGIVYAKRDDMKKAIPYFEQALEAESPLRPAMRISTLTNLGMAYDNLGEDVKALMYYDQALEITKNKKLPEDEVRILLNRSNVLRKKDPSQGIEELEQAAAVAQQIDSKLLLMDIYDDMAELYESRKDYKNAYQVLRKMRRMADSTYSLQKAKEIANLQSVYELERSNARVNELETLSRKNEEKRNAIIIVATVLGITLLLLLFVYRRSKKLNELLAKREKELQKSNAIKDKMFSIIGHDLRGSMGNIPMMLQMLKEDMVFDEEKKYIIDSLSENAQASTETLDKLLYWGQSQIKGIGLKQETFSTKRQIENALHLAKNSADIKQISITDKTAGDINVYADIAHFDFIMRNLLFNAIKFTYSNGTVEVYAHKNKKPGFITFEVKDNGIGISKEQMANIFEPFGTSTRGTANEKGTSIGLMLCKEFVKENGGEIWVESEPGKGSSFYFSLKEAS